jgi:NADH:ubiquinone oxidoreductase subunit 6 (subunit J)
MTVAQLAFYPLAGLALIGAAAAVLDRDPGRARAGTGLMGVALVGHCALLEAPVVALVAGVVVFALALLARTLPVAPTGDPARPTAAALIVAAGLAFVLVSTLARQYVSFGIDLDRRPGFGTLAQLGPELFGRRGLALAIVAGAFVCAAIAVGLVRRAPPVGRDP